MRAVARARHRAVIGDPRGKRSDVRNLHDAVRRIVTIGIDEHDVHARGPRATHVNRDDVADVERAFRGHRKPFERDLEDARVRLLDALAIGLANASEVVTARSSSTGRCSPIAKSTITCSSVGLRLT